MRNTLLLSAAAVALLCPAAARADDTEAGDSYAASAVTPYVKVGSVYFYRSYEDAFPKARKDGKLVLLYRMLGELDGLT
jgi:hypothetical protein